MPLRPAGPGSSLSDDAARILVVDDDRSSRLLLRRALEQDGYVVDEAEGGEAALALFERSCPDAVLLDGYMPDMDGFTVCSLLQKTPAANTPIVMVTALDDEESIAKAFAAGATDYITKPVNRGLLTHRLRKTIAERRRQERIDYLAHYDSLTGLPNRLLLVDRLRHGVARAARAGELLAVLYLDLNGFKEINDTMGHDAGDRLLRVVGDRLASLGRSCDTAARLGGDEFVMVLTTAVSRAGVRIVAERTLDLISTPVSIAGRQVTVTASVGVALYPDDGDDMRTLLTRADAAMYRAKQAGGNAYHWAEHATR